MTTSTGSSDHLELNLAATLDYYPKAGEGLLRQRETLPASRLTLGSGLLLGCVKSGPPLP